MKTRLIFALIVLFTAGMLTGGAFLLYPEEPVPFWVMQLMAIATLLFSYFLYRLLIKPYLLLASGMQLLKEQDFSTHLHPVKNKEANQLIETFNKMITHLRNERLAVREKNHFLDLLIEASPQGIVILDLNRKISEINPAGLTILNISSLDEIRQKQLHEASFELAPTLAGLQPGDNVIVRGSGMSVYRCIYSSFVDRGFDHPFILIEELTHELRNVEKSSYERIIRMMSHEVNNSVGAISATLNVVSEIFTQEENNEWMDVLPAVNASYDRCAHLAQFISNLAHVVRIPEPTLSSVSLNEQAKAVEALTRLECQRRNIQLHLSLTPQDKQIRVDAIQLEQVLVNILKNAWESIGENGEIRIITTLSPLSITIQDNGPGIPSEVKEKLFTPFFTTKNSGQGIGLLFVREVLTAHHCRFTLTTETGWTRFRIFFPNQQQQAWDA